MVIRFEKQLQNYQGSDKCTQNILGENKRKKDFLNKYENQNQENGTIKAQL